MNYSSLKRIEETILPSAKWKSIEISQNSIYLDFNNVELGNPKLNKELSLCIRFSKDSFISFFYNNFFDIAFLSNFDFLNQYLFEEFSFKVNKFKFLDFEYLDRVFKSFKKHKTFTNSSNFDVHNIRNDFFLVFEVNDFAIVIGANQMNFFNESEKLDDNILMELSNQWVLYYLNYCLKKKIIKDTMCEKHSLK